jgi:hypothetical protein
VSERQPPDPTYALRHPIDDYGPPELIVKAADTLAIEAGQRKAYFRVEFEEAKEAEDWFGIYQDLRFVVSAATQTADIAQRQWSQQQESGIFSLTVGPEDVVKQSLWTAALIAYVRCFATGVRARFDESIFDDREDVIQQHRYYKNIRDKHIAHSVNALEVPTTCVGIIDIAGDEPNVHSVATVHTTKMTEDSNTIRYLATLSEWLQPHAYDRHRKARRKVLRRAKALTKEQLRRLEPCQATPLQGYEAASMRRPPKPPTSED